jgi:hypothetical protein
MMIVSGGKEKQGKEDIEDDEYVLSGISMEKGRE